MVPRFGFADPDDYYSRASAATVLDRLRVPCLLVASAIDPMITPRAIEPFLPAHAVARPMPAGLQEVARRGAEGDRPADLTVLWHRAAGHVAFPGASGLEASLLRWLAGPAGPGQS